MQLILEWGGGDEVEYWYIFKLEELQHRILGLQEGKASFRVFPGCCRDVNLAKVFFKIQNLSEEWKISCKLISGV